ncbi:spore germination cell wall hydrolase CwlJ-like protein [Stakelama sediminis]|uniref:Spore germination cell wall hydrolase CwlJ-like protein n=2 Tax=Stakelama sediminis TaxID=463200 RepID=A0A840YYN7_9SPHN|nr:spore germination cell wall hydrolase CwlJ-like protein [Stakelama sediminis]
MGASEIPEKMPPAPLPGMDRHGPSPLLRFILSLTALAGIAVPLWLVTHTPKPLATTSEQPVRKRIQIRPQAPPPPVEPVLFQDLTPEQARAANAAVPFAKGPIRAASPFHLSGASDDQERALDCLSAAMLYEAGDDPTGERAIAQVVLNRVRHPAFPNSICGVIFEGSDRRTGCQFTFTCDGSLARHYSDDAWDRARKLAKAALDGKVDKTVGMATHYHTDWVVPYWSASLDKLVAVGGHLFFRWTGWWGTPPAFRMRYAGREPRIPALASLFDAHKPPAPDDETVDAASVSASAIPVPVAGNPDVFLVTLDPRYDPKTLGALAKRACADRQYCKFMAWNSAAQTPKTLPVSPTAISSMAFSYLRDAAGGFDKALWNCTLFPAIASDRCMHRLVRPLSGKAAGFSLDHIPGSKRADHDAAQEVPALSGVHRKPAPPPAKKATPDNQVDPDI